MVERGRVIAIEGPSGAGKTTLVRTAARSFGWTALPEAFDRLARPPNLRFRTAEELLTIERALLNEERRRAREANGRSRRGETVIADTGFLGPLTYTAGLVVLGWAPKTSLRAVRRFVKRSPRSAFLTLPDLIVYLDVPAATRRRRASRDAARHPADLRRRHETVGRVERRFYRDLAGEGAAGRVRFLRASTSARVVAARVQTLARAIPEERSPPANLSVLLDRLERFVHASSARSSRRVARHR